MQLSDDAKKLLKHFQDNDLAHGEYEYPAGVRWRCRKLRKSSAAASRLGAIRSGQLREIDIWIRTHIQTETVPAAK